MSFPPFIIIFEPPMSDTPLGDGGAAAASVVIDKIGGLVLSA